MKKRELSVSQRIIAVLIYLSVFLFICYWFNGKGWEFLFDSSNKYNILFVSGSLLLVFGSYIAEPFFTKPVDVITNSVAIILALLSIKDTNNFIGYQFLFFSACLLLICSILVIFLSYFKKIELFQKVFFELITKAGQSKIVFSFIYIFSIFSYFKNSPIEFTAFLTFWIIVVTQFFVENIMIGTSKILKFIFNNKKYSIILGQAIGCDNPFLYNVEVDFLKSNVHKIKKGDLVYLSLNSKEGAVGIIINEKYLLNKKWVTVYLLENGNNPLKVDLKTNTIVTEKNSIFSNNNTVYIFDINSIEDESKKVIEDNYLYKNKDNFIGYITAGSNINNIHFLALIDSDNKKYQLIREGSIIKTKIYEQETLFQIIDGKTNEEELEKHNTHGYLIGIAQKIGKYIYASIKKIDKDGKRIQIKEGGLEVVKWLPNIYSPVFLDDKEGEIKSPLSIGRLPTTNLEIVIKDIDSLVTHNTAILGILGIGKSCLTFELIQKVILNTNAKIICIDITNEYKKDISRYIDKNLIKDELSTASLKKLKDENKDGHPDDPTSWGNEELYKKTLDEELKDFEDNKKRILIINPDWHSVSKAGSSFKISHKIDLTVTEKTRIISERIFIHAKDKSEALTDKERRENKARYLIIFEEAHSLVPEFNSTANPGDQNASNGTAKVILQGRKYGLGSFVVTQRTANISKSILNQCNTIFALRVFDDTGKHFLENYIGSEYSNTLPTLEERHAIIIGKALKLKQPVIIELNNWKDIVLKK